MHGAVCLAMNIQNNPELLDRLAASYALGTLRGGARRRFEALARGSITIRVATHCWQERFAVMTELEKSVAPAPYVWTRIQNLLTPQTAINSQTNADANSAQNAIITALRHGLSRWKGIGLTSLAAAAIASVSMIVLNNQHTNQLSQAKGQVGQLTAQLKASPRVQYVAVLADDKAIASLLVTFDPKSQQLTVKRVGAYQEGADKSLQLWALPNGSAPQSLGVLASDTVNNLKVQSTQVNQVPTLAISLEPKGGVPSSAGPTGPVLFKGALLETAI